MTIFTVLEKFVRYTQPASVLHMPRPFLPIPSLLHYPFTYIPLLSFPSSPFCLSSTSPLILFLYPSTSLLHPLSSPSSSFTLAYYSFLCCRQFSSTPYKKTNYLGILVSALFYLRCLKGYGDSSSPIKKTKGGKIK